MDGDHGAQKAVDRRPAQIGTRLVLFLGEFLLADEKLIAGGMDAAKGVPQVRQQRARLVELKMFFELVNHAANIAQQRGETQES